MPPNNKKTASFLEGDEDPCWDRIARAEKENERLEKENEELKAKLAAYEEEEESDDDDDDDEDSVCDGSPWSKKYHLLKGYKQQHGDCNVPQSHKGLGIWVKDQKANYKKKKLTSDRIEKLEKLGIHWGKGYPQPKSWEDMFEELKEYKTTFGNCNIPVNDDVTLRTPLAKWVVEQRKQGKRLRKQSPSEMTMARYESLQEFGFIWKPRKKQKVV